MMQLFNRNTGGPQADETIRMATAGMEARVSALTISELLLRLERFTSGEAGADLYPWASRFVMGLPLPSWQRPFVWSREQCVRFIESIWMKVDLGTYLVNDVWTTDTDATGRHTFKKFSQVVLDGQQRLMAIEGYVTCQFPVADAVGIPRFWSELPLVERRRFANTHFARGTVQSLDEAELRKAYDLRAFGGTAHTEAQRAS